MTLKVTGFVPLTPQDQLEAVQQVFTNVFSPIAPDFTSGSPTNVEVQEITNMAINNNNSQSLLYSTIYNPNNTTGIFARGLCSFSNLQANPATYTVVTCQLTGISGTIIPINSIVVDTNGNQFQNLLPITLTGSPTDGVFTSLISGAISVAPNSVTKIQQNLSGWSTINNSAAGIIGSPEQSDTSLLNTRKYTLALSSVGWSEALASALVNFLDQTGAAKDPTYGYPYIQGYYIVENDTDVAEEIDTTGIFIAAKSVYITIYSPNFLYDSGGSQIAINAQYVGGLILRTKTGGCQTQNIQSGVNAFDVNYTNTKYNVATVNIKFDSPIPVPIQFDLNITVFSNTNSPDVIIALIREVILSQFYNGYNAYAPINMYQDIVANNFIPAIINTIGNANVNTITIQKVSGGSPASVFVALPPTQIATIIAANINVNLVPI